jgi:hypothetical protein
MSTTAKRQRTKQYVYWKIRQETTTYVLGNGNGVVQSPPSHYWGRRPQGTDEQGNTAYGAPIRLRYTGNGAPPEQPGIEVEVYRHPKDGVLTIKELTPDYCERVDVDSTAFNPNAKRSKWVYLKWVARGLSAAVGWAGELSTKITRREIPFFADDAGIITHETQGTAAAASKPDLASYIPAAGYHCYAVHFWDTYLQTNAVYASTAQVITTDLDDTDIQECFDQLPHNEFTPLKLYTLADNQASIDVNDETLDLRQFLNAPRVYGFPNPIAAGQAILIRDTHQQITFDLTVQGEFTVQGEWTNL